MPKKIKQKNLKKMPKVSVNIIHVNGEEILDNCLKSLMQTKYLNFQIAILLNNTTDNSEKIVRKYKVKLFKSKKNLGFAGGHNYLVKKTNSDYVVVLNNDTEVEKDWLKELVNFAEKNNADVCQPKTLNLKTKEYFDHAGAAGGFIDKYGYTFCRGRLFDKIEKDKGQYNESRRIFWACGSCFIAKREIIKKVGLFDEDFFMYSEEMDFCWRVNLAGGKIFCVPSSKIYHLGYYSVKTLKMNSKKDYLIHRNVLLSFLKNYSGESINKLIVKRILMEIASAIAFPKRVLPVTKSIAWIWKHMKEIKEKHKEVQSLRKISDKELQKEKIILKKSIAYQFFIKNKKTFKEIERYF